MRVRITVASLSYIHLFIHSVTLPTADLKNRANSDWMKIKVPLIVHLFLSFQLSFCEKADTAVSAAIQPCPFSRLPAI